MPVATALARAKRMPPEPRPTAGSAADCAVLPGAPPRPRASMRGRWVPLLTAVSATVLMASTLGTLAWLSVLFLVAFAARGLSSIGALPVHWDVEHMGMAMLIAICVASPAVVWLSARYFRIAWRAEMELHLSDHPKP